MNAIERGDGHDSDEYTNALYRRNWPHEAWLLLDEPIAQIWPPQIRALDTRSRAGPSTPTAEHSTRSTGSPAPTCGGGGATLAS
ncbi:hypothetical protein [Streptomyces sp. NPDC058718]|uniref:hypothetical protein n=1 Tax=Streptomyces sp. NPDC058718 TaxID=3346610 RepID=UPI0036CBE105